MLTWGTVVIHTRRTGECSTYTNMLDWLWWTQTNQYADLLALGCRSSSASNQGERSRA